MIIEQETLAGMRAPDVLHLTEIFPLIYLTHVSGRQLFHRKIVSKQNYCFFYWVFIEKGEK